MSATDKILKCSDCGKDFIFTAGEQEFHEKKGFSNPPKRCIDCKAEKKAQHLIAQSGDSPVARAKKPSWKTKADPNERVRFPAVCSRCQKNFDAPFEPQTGRPVFCRECFQATKG